MWQMSLGLVRKFRDCTMLRDVTVHKNMFNFLRDHDVSTFLQSDFIPAGSTVNQLVDVYNTVL